MVIDNFDLLRFKIFLSSLKAEYFYTAILLLRKKDLDPVKDANLNLTFGSKDERLLYWNVCQNNEELEDVYNYSKEVINRLGVGRLYISPNPKSSEYALLNMQDIVSKAIRSYVTNPLNIGKKLYKHVSKMSKTACTIGESNYSRSSNWILLDIDKGYSDSDVTTFINYLAFLKINHVVYDTFEGKHILVSYRGIDKLLNPNEEGNQIYKRFISNTWVEEKKDSLALVYGVKGDI